jgi:uncharacterized protein (DUF58 family)
MTTSNLIDSELMKKLEALRIQVRRAFPGVTRGERRSPRRGSSVEFADFRKYEAGDDFRHVDWNIYARLERLMLRQFVEEEDLRIDILIDSSASMRLPAALSKFDYARRIAALLAFLAVDGHDRVGVSTYDSNLEPGVRAARGRGHFFQVLRFLEAFGGDHVSRVASSARGPERPPALNLDTSDLVAESAGVEPSPGKPTDLASTLWGFAKAARKPGVLFVLSDFFDDSDYRRQVKMLAHDGFELNMIQILSRQDLEPQLTGDLELIDSETGQSCEISSWDVGLRAYHAALANFTAGLESFCRSGGHGYVLAMTEQPFEELLFKNLIGARMLS